MHVPTLTKPLIEDQLDTVLAAIAKAAVVSSICPPGLGDGEGQLPVGLPRV